MECKLDKECCSCDYMAYKKFITPIVIKILLCVGIVVAFFGGITIMVRDDFCAGLAITFLGPVAVRVASEYLMMPFRILAAIEAKAAPVEEAPPAPAAPPARKR
jgi:hypothetical protein